VAAQPIGWTNDDYQDLGDDIPLERCLSQMREAGYAGTELGRKFPREPERLRQVLSRHGLTLASGWHSAYLASGDLGEERRRWASHLDLLSALGCGVAIAAECTGARYPIPGSPLRSPELDKDQWKRLLCGLGALAEMALERGMRLAYHHHMGTAVQDLAQIRRLMENSRPSVRLLADTGHLAYAGVEPLSVFKAYRDRIAHVHLKDVRPAVLEEARRLDLPFDAAVRAGVFTVPGEGGVDVDAAQKLAHFRRFGLTHLRRLDGPQLSRRCRAAKFSACGGATS